MATLQDYAASAFYDFKQNFTGQDFVLGKDVESWVQALDYGVSKPTVYTISPAATIAVDAETASLQADVAVTLYRRDVLKFPGKAVIVIAEDVTIGTSATTVKILPAVEQITVSSVTITVEAEIAASSVTASFTASVAYPVTIGQQIVFGSTTITINENKTIGTGATTVAILASPATVADAATSVIPAPQAKTYGMLPILSMAEGGLPEMSGSDAEAMNKEQGLYAARRTVKRDGSITISGALLRNDPSLRFLQEIGLGSRNVYYQARYAPFTLLDDGTYSEGAGPGAYEVVTTLTNVSYPSGGQEFVQVNYTLNFSGRPEQYAPLLA